MNTYFFKDKRNGTYIELGALDGVLYSNTKFFQDYLGWKGILIEPHPDKFRLLRANRPQDFLFNDVVSNITEKINFRYFVEQHAACSGIENTLSKHHFDAYYDNPTKRHLPQRNIYLKPKTLTEIVKQTGVTHVDFLSLDVEGHEYEVLQSWDFSIPIDLILIETLGVQPDRDAMCRDLLIGNGYKFHSKHRHNEVYVSQDSTF